VRFRAGRRMYRIMGPDKTWLCRRSNFDDPPYEWVNQEDRGTLWGSIKRLRRSMEDGRMDILLDGLPHAAVQIVEYEVSLIPTKRKRRLSEYRLWNVEQYLELDRREAKRRLRREERLRELGVDLANIDTWRPLTSGSMKEDGDVS